MPAHVATEDELRDLALMGEAWMQNRHVPGCDATCDAQPSGMDLGGHLTYSACSPEREFARMVVDLADRYADSLEVKP